MLLIKDVTKVLNSQELKICIIVDKKNIPLGIFTDEDIRRLLIKKEYQKLNVKRYLNKNLNFVIQMIIKIIFNRFF